MSVLKPVLIVTLVSVALIYSAQLLLPVFQPVHGDFLDLTMSVSKTALIVTLVSVAWIYFFQSSSPKLPTVWSGFTHKDFKNVEKLFRQAIEDGRLKGGAIAAYYKGEVVVDLWGGYADVEANRPWKEDTATLFYSTTKFMGTLVLAMMADKGLLDYKKPVAHYWPEFGQNGKDKITVEMLLSHQGGLAVLDTYTSLFDIRDKHEEVEKLFVRQKPEYEPGSKFGYHSLTIGLYVDTLIRKVDPKHRNISQIFQEDIAEPFGIDFHVGLPLNLYYRSTKIYSMTPGQVIWDAVTSRSTGGLKALYLGLRSGSNWSRSLGAILELGHESLSPEVRSVGFTSFNGYGTARSVAKLFSILATGGKYKGRKLLSSKIIDYFGTPVVDGKDQTLEDYITYGPGPWLKRNPKGQTIFGQPGLGAQIGFADPHTGLGFAFCTNHLRAHHSWNDPLLLQLQNAVYAAISDRKM